VPYWADESPGVVCQLLLVARASEEVPILGLQVPGPAANLWTIRHARCMEILLLPAL